MRITTVATIAVTVLIDGHRMPLSEELARRIYHLVKDPPAKEAAALQEAILKGSQRDFVLHSQHENDGSHQSSLWWSATIVKGRDPLVGRPDCLRPLILPGEG